MKSKLSSIIERGDGDISTLLNGGVTLFPMRHGNRNMHFRMMEISWHNTNSDIISDAYHLTITTQCLPLTT